MNIMELHLRGILAAWRNYQEALPAYRNESNAHLQCEMTAAETVLNMLDRGQRDRIGPEPEAVPVPEPQSVPTGFNAYVELKERCDGLQALCTELMERQDRFEERIGTRMDSVCKDVLRRLELMNKSLDSFAVVKDALIKLVGAIK